MEKGINGVVLLKHVLNLMMTTRSHKKYLKRNEREQKSPMCFKEFPVNETEREREKRIAQLRFHELKEQFEKWNSM